MARRRRRVRLGSPPSAHGRKFAEAARDMLNRARMSKKAAEAGRCESALLYFGEAKYDQGAATAHHRATGKKSLGLRQYHAMVAEVSAAHRAIDKYCQVTRRPGHQRD